MTARVLPAECAAVSPRYTAINPAGQPPVLQRYLFDGITSPSQFTIYNGDGVGTVAIAGGELGLTINAGGTGDSFWFDADEGVLVYVPISGDFDAQASI